LRELQEECNLIGKNPKVFNTYGKPDRDSRKHVISVIYEVEVEDDSKLQAGDDASNAEYVSLKDLVNSPDKFAFDHYLILKDFISSKDYLSIKYKL
jgi:8-oxo-dGTP diphosphatase